MLHNLEALRPFGLNLGEEDKTNNFQGARGLVGPRHDSQTRYFYTGVQIGV